MSDVGVCGGAGGSTDGDVWIFNGCWDIRVLAHEIGHRKVEIDNVDFRLRKDPSHHLKTHPNALRTTEIRDDTYVMNYGTKERLSVGAANWLNRHLAFNESTMEFPWMLDVNSKELVDADRLVFKVRAHLNPCLSKD